MKTLIASLAVIAAVTAVAAPAAAQPYGQARHDQGRHEQARDWNGGHDRGARVSINERQQNLERRIDRGIRTGDLSRREAYRLRGESRQIAQLESRYRANGLSQWERQDLNRRMDRLESQIRAERHDRDNRRG
ncbi:hypothetical protein [uncultured Phenylobacterium sp.]|uniref:hypothetical protein n=1 Tax=uncultured Phenylobacterium sp. TaxID=349273 RepID=UPI0025D40A1B|nr:hypothetical protein [uncultured Phenylobacterium sp.]